jgi:hypothetical protein
MKKNDTLKKHHFWILFGLVPLFVLIAVLVVTSSVGAEIDKKLAEFNAAKDSLKKTAKSEKLVGILEAGQEKVKKKKTSLWSQNWDLQKELFTWPDSPQLKAVERLNLKFGDPIPEENFTHAEFKKAEVYLTEYSNEDPVTRRPATKGMVLSVAPTEFRGGWQRVLRHVGKNGWRAADPTSEEIWILMEDIWVQKSLLGAVQAVNQQMAAFQRVKLVGRDGITIDDPAPKATIQNPKHRRFESRTWAVELELKNKDSKQVLTGRLTNLTNRLQLMGLNNTMVLNVWLRTAGNDVRLFEYRIGGEFLPGAGAPPRAVRVKKLDDRGNPVKDKDGKDVEEEKILPANEQEIIETKDHEIPPTLGTPTEIVRVEQKFDTRTVPVRRIDALVLGKTDSRHEINQLVMPNFKAWEATAAPPTTDPTTDPTGTGAPAPGGRPGPGGFLGPEGGEAGVAGADMGAGTLDQVVEGHRKRYIDVKPQVRRMPVGIVVLVDQSLMQDVLLAFANTPLRFQVTQVVWKRFRDNNLGGTGTGTGSFGEFGSGDIVSGGEGNFSPELLGPPGGRAGSSPGPVSPGGLGAVTPGPMYGQGTFMSRPGGGGTSDPTNYTPYGPPGGGLTSVSQSQLTSGLIELHIYGVASLYEKYAPEQEAADAEKEAKEKEAKDKEAKDKEDKGTTPADGDPKKGGDPTPTDATTTDPKGKKMRRRVRARR